MSLGLPVSIKCAADFLKGVGILEFNSQFKNPTAAMLFTGYHLTVSYPVDLQSSSSFTFLSLGKSPQQE